MKISGRKLNYKLFFVLAVIFVLFFVLTPSETAFSQVIPPSIEFRCCYSLTAGPQQKICQDFHEDIGCQPPYWAEACPGVRGRCEDITNLSCYKAYCPEWTKLPIIPQKEEVSQKETSFVPPKLQISIPGLTLTTEESKLKICTECADPDIIDPVDCPKEKCKNWAYRIPWIGEYLAAFYKWAVGALAILAVIMIMINGVRWILAGGLPDKISEAKKGISSAIIGLVLVLLVHQILSLVDSRLTIFKPIVIGVIRRVEILPMESDVEEAQVGRIEDRGMSPVIGGQCFPIAEGSIETIKWNFGSRRSNGKRCHAGIDIFTKGNADVVAISSGKVIAIQRFYKCSGGMTDAILIDHGNFVVLYGEINEGTITVKKGDSVVAGQKLGKASYCGMLHFEMYEKGTSQNYRWFPPEGKEVETEPNYCRKYFLSTKPKPLLDPTETLKDLQSKKCKL